MTLRNVIVLAQSGLVLFAKDFVHGVAQPRLLGSLLTAVTEFSMQTTGMKPTFIELSSMAVTIVRDDVVKLMCALVHDRNDSAPFGRLIATEILSAFIEEYSVDRLRTPLSLGGHNLKDFHGFDAKIAGIVQNSVRPVLQKLQAQRGVIQALLVTEEAIVQGGGGEVDQFGVLATLQYMNVMADTLMEYAQDVSRHIVFDDEHDESRTLLWRIENCILLVAVSKRVSPSVYADSIDHAMQSKSLISQVVAFAQAKTSMPLPFRRA
ncbi:hypothetical protein CTAYLR_004364 [Chrysophaeum taylorii]|uniref:Uncharacterized protein n=1 Tax=Chrysophaeum taylorii TaxID=2483200 RepID=A0AAD7UNB1_9STRA|nr:hypothetical protein CTAYLR_004364 [Chrysophaeum taylorii]